MAPYFDLLEYLYRALSFVSTLYKQDYFLIMLTYLTYFIIIYCSDYVIHQTHELHHALTEKRAMFRMQIFSM